MRACLRYEFALLDAILNPSVDLVYREQGFASTLDDAREALFGDQRVDRRFLEANDPADLSEVNKLVRQHGRFLPSVNAR